MFFLDIKKIVNWIEIQFIRGVISILNNLTKIMQCDIEIEITVPLTGHSGT